MEKRKFVLGLLLGIMLFSTLSGFVSAAYYSPSYVSARFINSWVDFAEPVLSALFGGFGWNGMYLFERLLLFIMLASIVYLAIGRMPMFEKKTAIKLIIAIVIPLIGIRFINYEWLTMIIEQYMAVSIMILSVLPTIIYFFFIYNSAGDHGIVRKIGWILYIGIYMGLWSSTSNPSSGVVYFWTFIVGLILLFGDNFIYARYRALQNQKNDEFFKSRESARINQEIASINNQITQGFIDQRTGQKMIKELNNHRQWLMKQS